MVRAVSNEKQAPASQPDRTAFDSHDAFCRQIFASNPDGRSDQRPDADEPKQLFDKHDVTPSGE